LLSKNLPSLATSLISADVPGSGVALEVARARFGFFLSGFCFCGMSDRTRTRGKPVRATSQFRAED